MNSQFTLQKAIEIVTKAHVGQVDKVGADYIYVIKNLCALISHLSHYYYFIT
jgi:hypothetical protein